MRAQRESLKMPTLVWGVVRDGHTPCLFGHQQDAEENCDSDERVALFRVEEVSDASVAPPRALDRFVTADGAWRIDDQTLMSAVTKEHERAEVALRLARQATNGWASYARTKLEHNDIARLHKAIDEASSDPARLTDSEPGKAIGSATENDLRGVRSRG